MNSDKNSIQSQGGGEPQPFKPNQIGGSGDSNQGSPSKPQNPSGNNPQTGGSQGGNNSETPKSPAMAESSGPGQQQGSGQGGMQKPNTPGSGGNDSSNIPSPPGPDSDFQKNFSQSKGEMGGGMPGESKPQNNNMMKGGNNQPPNEPPQEFDTGDNMAGDEFPPKEEKSNKKLFIILLIVILALGAAVAVYFLFLSPSDQPATTGDQEDQQEQVDQDTTDQPDSVPVDPNAEVTEGPDVGNAGGTTTTDEGTSTSSEDQIVPPEGGGTQTSNEIPADSHESLLSSPADNESNASLDPVSLSSLNSELEQSTTETPLFTEWVLQDTEGNLVRFSELMNVVAPTVFSEDVASQFNQDATVLTYTDSQGSWLGIAANLTEEADAESVKSQVSNLENNISEVRNFFFSGPGAESSWADGGAGDVTSRYLTFNSEGASFNYGWDGNTLIIGTSYSAFQEIVNHL